MSLRLCLLLMVACCWQSVAAESGDALALDFSDRGWILVRAPDGFHIRVLQEEGG